MTFSSTAAAQNQMTFSTSTNDFSRPTMTKGLSMSLLSNGNNKIIDSGLYARYPLTSTAN